MKIEQHFPTIARDLGLEESKLMQEIKRKNVYLVEDKYSYLRFRKEVRHVEEGTVVFLASKPEYMRGFPKIRRILFLKEGLKKHFSKKFYAEEKMDGYNVRVAKMHGDIVALTRGGLICPYTSEKIAEQLSKNKFFTDFPEYMLCGEVVGLQNPYQMKSYPEARGFGYFVFDIRHRKTNKAVPLDQKAKLLKKYGLKGVKSFGQFSPKDYKKLLKIVRDLGADRREGIVLKDENMNTLAKYTSNHNTNRDLEYAFKFAFDYGQAFFFRRLVREAFQAYESGLKGKGLDEEATRLGKSILNPLVDTIKQIADGKEVTEDFDIEVPSEEFGRYFVSHLRQLGVKATVSDVRRKRNKTVLRIKRHNPATHDKVKLYLKGEFAGE